MKTEGPQNYSKTRRLLKELKDRKATRLRDCITEGEKMKTQRPFEETQRSEGYETKGLQGEKT